MLAIEQQHQYDEAAAKAANADRVQRREKIFSGEQAFLTMAADWRVEAENGKMEESENKIALLLSYLTDLLATCITQQEDIHSLDDALTQVHSRLRQLEQRPVAAPDASSSNTSDRLEALEIDVGSLKDGVQLQQIATLQLEQRICTGANHSSSEPRETAPEFDGQEIFCDSTKMTRFHGSASLSSHCSYTTSRNTSTMGTYNPARGGGAKHGWTISCPSTDGLPVERQGQIGKLRTAESDSTILSTPLEHVTSRVATFRSEAHAKFDSPPLLYYFEDYTARLVPTLGTHAQGQDVYVAFSPSGNGDLSSSSGSSQDSAREFIIEVLDPLTSEDYTWLPLPATGHLPGSQCEALCAHLHTYLSFYAPPTSSMDDEVAVGDILAYVTRVVHEFGNQWNDNNNPPVLYVRIQVGQASCSTLLDSDASRSFMSQAFMQKAGLGAQVRRKANPTAIKLADRRTQKLIDRYIEAVPVYFAPHACEAVMFDILDKDLDIILGMPWLASADHTVNFRRQTLTVHDAFGAEVSCTIPLPHPSIRCQVVTAKSFRATCAYEKADEIGLCFLRTVAVADFSPTNLSSDPRVVRLLDEFAEIFESPTGVVPDRPISHEIILEAGAVPLKGCIYRISEEELMVLRAQLDDLLDKGWIRPIEQRPVAAPNARSSNISDRLDALENDVGSLKDGVQLQQTATLQLEQRICTAANNSSSEQRETTPKFDRQEIFCDSTKTDQISWFRKFELTLQLHNIKEHKHHRYLYSRSGGACQAWLDNLLSKYGVVAADLHTKINWDNLKAAWHKQFQVEPSEIKVYFDDILVYTRPLEDHFEHLRRLLETLRRAKHKANRDKCEFVRQELEYLGHFVTPEGISPLLDKIQAIQEWREPRNVTDVHSFLGLTGYYHRFI
ncbi:hypothetical protein CBR_g40259 [Chara braunii]|uniref:Reverse transcriptase domain-containing protein n=1 Tax=Chara braunii TaxID=69332 RepID=A0A388K1T5_CHABU|nr:hypothetical protein CBR_g40259 [Chara braunii]|eukprot:GBG64014.1 hypothetical protein CBR_g40259 [Chara braunii]